MRSTFHKAGNINLKGRKSKTLNCGCCEVQNFKDRELKREHIKYIIEETNMKVFFA